MTRPPEATKDIRFKEGLELARRSDLDKESRLRELARLEVVCAGCHGCAPCLTQPHIRRLPQS